MLGIDTRAARAVWTAALVTLALFIAYTIRSTLIVFTIALLFAYLLFPLVDFMSRRFPAKSRTLALAVAYALVTGVLVLLIASIGTQAAKEARSLAESPPDVTGYLANFRTEHPSWAPFISAAEDLAKDNLGGVLSRAPAVAVRLLTVSGSLIYVVLVPILSFFFLRDGHAVREWLLEVLPMGRMAADSLLEDVHKLLLQYVRALLYLCGATLVTFSIVLSAMGVPYALLLAALAFALEFVPMAGPLTAALVIILASVFTHYPHVWWVIIFLGVYRLFQDYVLSPHLMGEGVEMHPLLVIFGILAGAEIGGIAGMFLSIPVLALVRLGYHRLDQRLET